jgi:ABC-type tungstate transport system permease subunit
MFIRTYRDVATMLSTQGKTTILLGIVIIAAVSIYFLYPRPTEQFIVSTTTSLYETGLLDILKQRFEQTYPGHNVSFISQGTGKAIATAQRGDADMILVHDPVKEFAFLEEGYGVNRKIIAYNFFIIVGPDTDPADVLQARMEQRCGSLEVTIREHMQKNSDYGPPQDTIIRKSALNHGI